MAEQTEAVQQDEVQEIPIEQEAPLQEQPRQEPEPVPPAPLEQQRSATHHQGGFAGPIRRVITTRDEVMVDPRSVMRNKARTVSPAKQAEEEKSSRELLDDFMGRPEASDYHIRISRYLPTHMKDGTPVPIGNLHETQMMPYDSLKQEILDSWGGGEYRCVVYDGDGEAVRGMKAFVIVVPITSYKPKLEKYAQLAAPEAPARDTNGRDKDNPEDSPATKERKQLLREQAELDLLEERAAKAKAQRSREEIKAAIEMKQLERLQREAMGGDNSAKDDIARQMKEDRERLEARMEADRKASEERAEKDRQATRDMFKELTASIIKVAESANRPPADNGLKEVLVAMQNNGAAMQAQTTNMLAAIIPALAQKPADTGMKDLFSAMQQSNAAAQAQQSSMLTALIPALTPKPVENNVQAEMMKATADMVMKSAQRENTNQQNMINAMIQSLMTNKEQGFTPDVMMRVMEMGEKRLERSLNLAQQFAGGGGREDEEEREAPAEGYDPKLGFLGNAGKALFYGLKKLPELAVQHPQIANLLLRLFNTSRPSDAQIAEFARRQQLQQASLQQGEGDMALPPPVAPPQQQMQMPPRMQQVPPPVSYQPQGGSIPPRMAPPQQQPPQAQQPPAPIQQPAQAAPMVRAQGAITPDVQKQIDAATEIEGESTGIDIDDDGVPDGKEELEAELAASEARLKDAISTSMKLLLTDIVDGVERREWPEDATECWHQEFKRMLVNAPDNQQRVILIQKYCDGLVWSKVVEACRSKPEELVRFYGDLARLVDMNAHLRNGGEALKPAVPAPQAPAMSPPAAPVAAPAPEAKPQPQPAPEAPPPVVVEAATQAALVTPPPAQ